MQEIEQRLIDANQILIDINGKIKEVFVEESLQKSKREKGLTKDELVKVNKQLDKLLEKEKNRRSSRDPYAFIETKKKKNKKTKTQQIVEEQEQNKLNEFRQKIFDRQTTRYKKKLEDQLNLDLEQKL